MGHYFPDIQYVKLKHKEHTVWEEDTFIERDKGIEINNQIECKSVC